MSRLLLIALLLLPIAAAAALPGVPQDEHSAVVFVYHRVGVDTTPYISIRQEQFASHIRELTEGNYNVMKLPDIIAAFKAGTPLPPKTVAITFDEGHRSVLNRAIPLLEQNNLPFTVFISSGYVDEGGANYINWDDLRRLKKNPLVTIGLHPARYTRLYEEDAEDIRREINNAKTRYREELSGEPTLFAYPFGEYSKQYRDIIEQQGFAAAFGQQSGVAYPGADIFTLPRFSMTEAYGNVERFIIAANALPLPVSDIEPEDPHIASHTPNIGFTLSAALSGLSDQLSCFASGQGKPDMEIIDNRVELRLEEDFDQERTRINCTLPAPPATAADEPRWRWLGMLLTMPSAPEENPDYESPEPAAGPNENVQED